MPALHEGPPAIRLGPGGGTPALAAPPASIVAAPLPTSGPGQPLLLPVQLALETSLQVPLGPVRVHSDAGSAAAASTFGARAFTYGPNIFLGSGQRPSDLGLMAHEAAHVVQQSVPALQRSAPNQSDVYEREAEQAAAAVLRQEPFTVHERTNHPRVQRLGISDALNYFADKANLIPGFRMLTIILGVNPINMSRVERSAANIMRAVVEFIPGGALITQALDKYGVFDRVGSWVEEQIRSLGMAASAFKDALKKFLDSLSLSDIFNLGGVWERAKRIFTEPINRIIDFLKGLASGIIKFIKEAILRPLAKLAEGTRGYDLLKAVLGKDPVTGEPVPRNAETLIGGFMKLIGQEEVWNNIKKANALSRAWAWFQGAMKTLLDFVQQVPKLIIDAFKSLELSDIILLPRAFAKIFGVVGDFLGRFISWAGNAVWSLLQIIFEVVAPGAIPYLKKVAAAFRKILKDPIGFVGNLVKAGKLGFQHFADKIGDYLKASIIEWLTGSLPTVYIPKALELKEIVKFVLSVLGLTWQNIRAKLVKIIGETAMKALETGFDIVITLVTQGPAAAWEKIKEQLGNLKDMVLGAITNFVVETIVKKAVAKVLSLLVPGGAFIQAIISIYDTIKVFIEKLQKIIQVATAFLNSIVDIANGVIAAAADKVEKTLAGLLTLAINFLAGFLGLGGIAEKVMEIINKKVREPIDKALDKVVDWIVTTAKKLFAKLFGKKDERTEEQKKADLDKAMAEGQPLLENRELDPQQLSQGLEKVRARYKLAVLTVVSESKTESEEVDYLHGAINPEVDGKRTERPLSLTEFRTPPGATVKVTRDWSLLVDGKEIDSYTSHHEKVRGSGLDVHHLLEKRFLGPLNRLREKRGITSHPTTDKDAINSVVLAGTRKSIENLVKSDPAAKGLQKSPLFHRWLSSGDSAFSISAALQDRIMGIGTRYTEGVEKGAITPGEVFEAHKEAYDVAGKRHWTEAIKVYFRGLFS
jgi:hypothetical protein